MTDTALQLGDFTFANYEIPADIKLGGKQRIATHKLIGGARVLDAMGRDDDEVTWSGWFYGANALARARHVDYLRAAGAPLKLTWGEFSYTVVIADFSMTYERGYQLRYSIACMVVSDDASPVTSGPPPDRFGDFGSQLTYDFQAVQTNAAAVGDPTLISQVSTLGTAMASVTNFATATKAQLTAITTPLAAAQIQVQALISTTLTTVASVSTLGGLLPNNPLAKQAATFSGQLAAIVNQPALYNIQSTLGRMSTNIAGLSTPSGAKTVTLAGGNLMAVAAQQYGDSTQWVTIAQANGMTDPIFTGLRTLTIPPSPRVSGGVPGS